MGAQTGKVPYSELLAATYVRLTDSHIAEAFRRFDITGKGRVSLYDLQNELGENARTEDLKDLNTWHDRGGKLVGNKMVSFGDLSSLLHPRSRACCLLPWRR